MAQASNREISVARAYHEATKHSYTSVRSGAHFLDWNNRPLPYKIYPGAGTLALPRDLSLPSIPTLGALRGRVDGPEKPLDLERLTRLLFCAGGLTKRANVGGEDYHFRAAASAGALYPVELYLVAGEIDGVERGLYHFLPADLKLHGLRRGDWRPYLADCTGSASLCRASAVIIMTSIFWRSAWKYRARAYRYCFWDSGMILANLLAAANADALASEIITAFKDQPLEELLEVDGDREGIACIAAVGQADTSSAESPVLTPMELESIPLSAKEVVYEDLVRLQRASRLSVSEEVSELARTPFDARQPESSSDAITLEAMDDDTAAGLGETILRRGSTRVFARTPIAAEELAAILATSQLGARGDFAGVVGSRICPSASITSASILIFFIDLACAVLRCRTSRCVSAASRQRWNTCSINFRPGVMSRKYLYMQTDRSCHSSACLVVGQPFDRLRAGSFQAVVLTGWEAGPTGE